MTVSCSSDMFIDIAQLTLHDPRTQETPQHNPLGAIVSNDQLSV